MAIYNASEETGTPATPTAGRQLFYPKSGGWYKKNSAGTETKLVDSSDLDLKAALAGSASQAFSVAAATAAAHAVRLDQTTVGAPAFKAYLPTATQSVSSGVETKVTLTAEVFDTAAAFDTATNYRFTPQVAGYYQISFAALFNATGTSVTDASASLYKNGSVVCRGNIYNGTAITSFASVGSDLIDMNGTSDYLELFCTVVGTSPGIYFGSPYTYLSGSMIRR